MGSVVLTWDGTSAECQGGTWHSHRIEGKSSNGSSEAEINVMFGVLRRPGSRAHWVILDGWMRSDYEGLKPQALELKLLKLMSLFIFADVSH